MFRVLKPFEYLEPTSVAEAVDMLARLGDKAQIFAGGTDLVISMKKRECAPEHLIAIGGLAELDHITLEPDGILSIGPLATHADVARSPVVREHFEMLATACNEVGTPQVRNMGTIGGNVCKAGPSQDSPPALVALEASLRLVSPKGERVVRMDEFCTGAFCTIMAPDELLTEIRIPPLPSRSAGCYKWVTKITATDETLVGVGVVLALDTDGTCSDVRIGMGSVAPIAMRARRAESLLRGRTLEAKLFLEVAEAAAKEAQPRSRPDYRRHMVRVLVNEALDELWRKLA